MLITTILLEKSTLKWLKVNNDKISRFNDDDSKKITKKLEKLKSKKLFKSQKLAQLGKKLIKNGNLLNFGTKKTRPSFLTFSIKEIFNCL